MRVVFNRGCIWTFLGMKQLMFGTNRRMEQTSWTDDRLINVKEGTFVYCKVLFNVMMTAMKPNKNNVRNGRTMSCHVS